MGQNFIPLFLEEQPEITATLSKEDLDVSLIYHYHIKNVDFKRVGILILKTCWKECIFNKIWYVK